LAPGPTPQALAQRTAAGPKRPHRCVPAAADGSALPCGPMQNEPAAPARRRLRRIGRSTAALRQVLPGKCAPTPSEPSAAPFTAHYPASGHANRGGTEF